MDFWHDRAAFHFLTSEADKRAWWLNAKGGTKAVPTTSYQAQSNRSNTIFINPEQDLVVVWRWHAGSHFFARVVASITDATTN